MNQLLKYTYKYTTLHNGKVHSVTYHQEIEDLTKKFPNLTLAQLNNISYRPVLHRENGIYYEITIQDNNHE